MSKPVHNGELILYQTDDGLAKINLTAIDGTVWLTQDEIADLFDKGRSTVTEHIQNILSDRELDENSVCRNFRRTAKDGKDYSVLHYNLDMILAVGFWVRSPRGAQFRRWANTILKEYLVKGFAMDDERLKQADLAMNGAHSMPMRGLLENGESSVWATGDLGRKDRGGWDSTQGLGEIGYGYGFSPSVQIGMAIGTSFNDQKFSFDNKIEEHGTYVIPELIWRASGNLYLSLLGYYNDGEAKTRRSYLNAGAPDTSSGKTDIATYGGRVRLDWLSAFQIFDTSLTPNISYSYIKTKSDAYTETNGGFPVTWDAHSEKSNIARLGLDAVRPVTPSLNLLARVEGAYRFDSKGDNVSGQIIGLNGFKFSGRDHDQFWARGGIGAEADLAHGTASFMVNGTTANGNPNYWLSATYRIKF